MQIKQWQDLRINGSVLPSLKKWWENSGSCFFLCCWELLNIGCHVKRLRDFVSWYWPVEHLFGDNVGCHQLIYLFVYCFSFLLRIFHSYWDIRRAANFDLCSALMAIKQWVFFSMPHLHVYCDTRPGFSWSHPIWLVTFTPFTKCLGVELPLPVLTT